MKNTKLDAWIAKHVMDSKFNSEPDKNYSPTGDPKDTLRLLEKIAQTHLVQIKKCGERWNVSGLHAQAFVSAETLPLAICLFAKAILHDHVNQTHKHTEEKQTPAAFTRADQRRCARQENEREYRRQNPRGHI